VGQVRGAGGAFGLPAGPGPAGGGDPWPGHLSFPGLLRHYLAWVLDELVRTAPENVSIQLHRNRAVRLAETETRAQVVTLDDGTSLLLDCVVLAQGHTGMPVSAGTEMSGLREYGFGYLPPGNPAEADLAFVGPCERGALRGLGLNFFDLLDLLTVGRGGEFHREGGALRYWPSGEEPRIFTGSRRRVPYHYRARGENQKRPFGRHVPAVLTPARIAALCERRQNGEQVEFQRHIWPLVDREVTAVYYATLISRWRGPGDAKAFLAEYTTPPVSGPADEELLKRHGIGPDELWDWDRVAHPYGDRVFTDPAAYQSWLLGYLHEDLAEARDGNVASPLKAALDVLRNEVRLAVDHAGITGESYPDGLQSWYTPLNAFVSIGPPHGRIEELIALIEAGVVEMVGPGLHIAAAPDDFVVSSVKSPAPSGECPRSSRPGCPTSTSGAPPTRSCGTCARAGPAPKPHPHRHGRARGDRRPDSHPASQPPGGRGGAAAPLPLRVRGCRPRRCPGPRRRASGPESTP
jgi:L-aspartate N-monooxygenase (nitrosuccinate-forming)